MATPAFQPNAGKKGLAAKKETSVPQQPKLEEKLVSSVKGVMHNWAEFGFSHGGVFAFGEMIKADRFLRFGSVIKILLKPGPKQYGAIYVNEDTLGMDARFGMRGYPIDESSETWDWMKRATASHSLGHAKTEAILFCFADSAKRVGRWVGLNEAEFIKNNEQVRLMVEAALEFKDTINEVYYLKRITVEGVPVLIPANLDKPIVV